jgi:glycosyltransferase involved in cell wall biosynthesis
MYTLVAFATQWGSRYGGINSFNADFLMNFAFAYQANVQTICIVRSASDDQIKQARKSSVRLIPLRYTPQSPYLMTEHGEESVRQLKELGLSIDPNATVWLGHDRITGHAAIAAAKIAGGRSAIIAHMSYDHYESYAESSHSALEKTTSQRQVLQDANIVLAVGPLLRDAAKDLVGASKTVHMLIPGLAEIDTQVAPTTFTAFLSGRLTEDAERIKQGHLGIAAFATAQYEARRDGRPDSLRKQPKLILRGVDVDGTAQASKEEPNVEKQLKQFAETYAQAVVNLHTLPFTENRTELFSELARASVCLMPSWHEGFGLVAWEAIAAGVPIIITINSGVYRFLEEVHPGSGTGCVYAIDVDGTVDEPFFSQNDLDSTVALLKTVADDPDKARLQAATLRTMVGERQTWLACAEEAVLAFEWPLEKGSAAATPDDVAVTASAVSSTSQLRKEDAGPLQIPSGQWRAGIVMADSQLLRAEEAVLAFDAARQADVDSANEWIDDSKFALALRLITGPGGQGKTRLALELCGRRQEAGWYAGFIDRDLEPAAVPGAWRSIVERRRPMLIVLDYAETRQNLLLSILREAISDQSDYPVRILLLARDAGEWWENLPSKDSQCEAFLLGYAASGPFALPPLYEETGDRDIAYQKAVLAFADVLGVTAPANDPDLTGDHFARPLYIQMAALLSLYGERPITSQGLTRALLNHERRYWSALLAHFDWPEPEKRAEQLLALATLAGGFSTPNDAQAYWPAAKAGVISIADFNTLFRKLATLYPGTPGLQPMRPDLLGEALVAQALLRPGNESLVDGLLSKGSTPNVRRNALTVLARLSNERADLQQVIIGGLKRQLVHCGVDLITVATASRSRLPELAERAVDELETTIRSQVCEVLSPFFEEDSVELAYLCCKVNECLCQRSQDKSQRKPKDTKALGVYAVTSSRYSVSLARAGRKDEAREIGKKTVRLFRELRSRGVKGAEDQYAGALGNYANRLSDAGEYGAALEYDREALSIRRQLAQQKPYKYGANYATLLSNYAAHLSMAGRTPEAVEYDSEAIKIQKRFAENAPDAFEPQLVGSLGNYAVHLMESGRYEEALEHASEAVGIGRRLVEKIRDRLEPDFARALSTLASGLTDVGRYEDSCEIANEALQIQQRLELKNPDRFDGDLAAGLVQFAQSLTNLGSYWEATEHLKIALPILDRLAQQNSKRYARSFCITVLFARNLSWLSEESAYWESPDDLRDLIALIPAPERNLILIYADFTNGCEGTDQQSRERGFGAVVSQWEQLSNADKNSASPSWLCAGAWCAKFGNTSAANWQEVWFKFKEQRGGRIPHWMKDISKRLDFEWPR